MNKLNPIRVVETKRVIQNLLDSQETDLDSWIRALAKSMVDTPPVVSFAARSLKDWNEHGEPQFSPAADGLYLAVAEVVLDSAAEFRGDAYRVLESTESAEPVLDEALTEQNVLKSLQGICLFLRSVADGRTNAKLAETHARHLTYIARWLEQTKFQPVTD